MEYDYIIVGGGITGLFAGYLLQKHDKNFLLFEKDENVGQKMRRGAWRPNFTNIMAGRSSATVAAI